jgi:hypothetical protein
MCVSPTNLSLRSLQAQEQTLHLASFDTSSPAVGVSFWPFFGIDQYVAG